MRGFTERCGFFFFFFKGFQLFFLALIKNALSDWVAMKGGGNQANDCNGPDHNDPLWQREGLRAGLSVCITVKQTEDGL